MPKQTEKSDLIDALKAIVGATYLLTGEVNTKPYSKGYRFGSGSAFAVVRPGTLLEIWRILQCCAKENVVLIMQAANTGLTGGSTPDGNDYDRPIVIVNTMRVNQIQLINKAKQIIGLPGSTLFGLEEVLAPYGREPHSVIGSSCIGASIVGGVCNNSGGALVQRGPAYTELALYAKIHNNGEVKLVNNLGIKLGSTPEEILQNLEQQRYTKNDIQHTEKLASDNVYHERVREIDADTPARFNNDGRRLHEASGCAGKLVVFAVRLDTYPTEKKQVFYIGSNDESVFETIRRDILSSFKTLPVSGEYLHRDCYAVSKKYGKDAFLVIDKLGSKYIPKLFGLKRKVDRIAGRFSFFPAKMSDRIMQVMSYLWPNHLPTWMDEYHRKYQHHLILEMSGKGIGEACTYLQSFFKDHEGNYFECSPADGEKAILHRFVAGGAINRYHAMKRDTAGEMMTVDVALRRNEEKWFEQLPAEIDSLIEAKFYYGHLFCHVMHQNYVLKKGVNADKLKAKILASFDSRGAEYPAEHNVGHEYAAKPVLKTFYRKLDPTNTFNPGIGKTSKLKNWVEVKK